MRRGRGPGTKIALVAAGVAGAAVGGWLVVHGLSRGTAGDAGLRGAGDAGPSLGEAGDAGPRTDPPAGSGGPTRKVEPIRQAPDSPDRPMPYRPAKLLRYSDGLPSKDPAADDASPVLERILQVTRPDADQEPAIRAAWRAHEDGRRELLARARPPSIGEPVLDHAGVVELDRAFDELLAAILRHEQLARLALEMPPPELEPELPAP
jgi:hypothetical protein